MFHVDPTGIATSSAPAAAPTTAAPSTGPRALIERQIAVLTELADIGMEIARAAGRAAADPAAEEAADAAFRGDPCLGYTRVARAVRQTFALQVQLLKDLAALEDADGAAASKRKSERTARLRTLVTRAVKDDLEFDDWRARERFAHQARERLSDAEDDAALDGLPVAEVVARICADLDLSPDWTARLVKAAGGEGVSTTTVIPDGPPSPIRDPGPSAPPSLRDDTGPPPRDEGEGEDTFLEWPPPS